MITDQTIIGQLIKRIDISFNTYKVRTIFKINFGIERIIAFALDSPDNKIIMLTEPQNK